MELLRRRADPAFVHDGLEHAQGGEVHSSRYENELFLIIHFLE
jgi:hypothetical protein